MNEFMNEYITTSMYTLRSGRSNSFLLLGPATARAQAAEGAEAVKRNYCDVNFHGSHNRTIHHRYVKTGNLSRRIILYRLP